MKRLLIAALALGLTAMPALAGSTVTPMQGTLGNPFNNGQVSGYGWNAAQGGGAGTGLGNLYDNILTINGGAATGGFFGVFSTPGTGAFVDWNNTLAQWGDDLHGISAGGPGPAVITSLVYGYSNAVATTTHIIKLYDMVPPSVTPTVTSLITKGVLVGQVTVVGNPTGANLVTVTGLNIQLPQSAIWIKFEEVGAGFPGTYWLTGGNGNGVGTSNPGVLYNYKYSDGTAYNLWIPFPYFYFSSSGSYVASNIQVALNGYHVPAPAVMSLLGLGGLVTLRRRRSR